MQSVMIKNFPYVVLCYVHVHLFITLSSYKFILIAPSSPSQIFSQHKVYEKFSILPD
jgi:hypothetical protein